MKAITAIALVFVFTLQGTAQPHKRKQEHREKIRAHKIGFLTEKLDLSPEEAQQFWPLYNELEAERQSLQKEFIDKGFGKERKVETMSDEELDEMVLQRLEQEKAMVDLKIEYYDKFKDILPVRKVFLLYRSELEFRKMLIERLRPAKPPRK